MEFQRGASGYHRRQVREFLERVAHEVEELLVEMEGQRAELDRRAETIAALQTVEAELQRSILAAERIGNDIKLNARKEAELIVQEAENLTAGRLQAADGQLRAARQQMARLEREHALFRDQFRGMLDAYSRSLDNQPRLGDTLGSSGDTRLTTDPEEDADFRTSEPAGVAATGDEGGKPAPTGTPVVVPADAVPTAVGQAATRPASTSPGPTGPATTSPTTTGPTSSGTAMTHEDAATRPAIAPLEARDEGISEVEARPRDSASSADVSDPSLRT